MYNFASILDHNVVRFPDKVAVSLEGERLTYWELYARVNALAAALTEGGVTRGQRVALLMNNSIEFLESVFALNRIGAAFVPLNTRLAVDEWRHVIEHSGAVGLLAEGEFRVQADNAIEGLNHVAVRILVRGDGTGVWRSYEEVLAGHDAQHVEVVDVDEDEMHRLMYTSGTTARPKGVPLSHKNVLWKNFSHIIELGITSDDSTLVIGPMYHVGGFDIPAIDTLHAGGSLVIMRKFDPLEVIRQIAEHKPTTTWMAPSMLKRVIEHPQFADHDTSSLRLIIFGSEKSPQEFVQKLIDAFPGAWISDGYGMTETCSGIAFNDAQHAVSKAGSVGRPVLHAQVKIVNDVEGDVPLGELGEVAIRGPMVFGGYLDDEQATQSAFRDGWFLTGDIGRIDEGGHLYIEDRKKDMIKSGGENIASAEVERVIYEHPAVFEASVIAAPHPRWGEVPHAFVVIREGVELSEAELQEFCRERLARFKVPNVIQFVSTLPTTAGGKVLKRELRDWLTWPATASMI